MHVASRLFKTFSKNSSFRRFIYSSMAWKTYSIVFSQANQRDNTNVDSILHSSLIGKILGIQSYGISILRSWIRISPWVFSLILSPSKNPAPRAGKVGRRGNRKLTACRLLLPDLFKRFQFFTRFKSRRNLGRDSDFLPSPRISGNSL